MPSTPRADTRAAVVHAIATATRYRTGTTTPTATVTPRAVDLLPVVATGFPDLDDLVDATTSDLAGSVVTDLALDGLIDLYEYLDGNATLTPAGVAEALNVRPAFERRNLTVEWFDRFLTPQQYEKLVRHIAFKAKHSRDESEIREFVHDYIAKVGARDGLRDRIIAGDDPSPGSIRSWIWKQTLSTWRDEGTDAQTRTVKGSRTDRDLHGATPNDAFASPTDGPTAVVYEAPEGSDGGHVALDHAASGMSMVDVVDPTPSFTDLLLHQEALRKGMARLEEAVRASKPGAADRYARVLGHMAKGMTPAEVADAENVSHARAATLIAEVRAAGRQRARVDRARVAVIRYVHEEPMSTVSDLVSELDADKTAIRDAVSELLADGFIARHNGGSLEVTDLGIANL